MGLRQSFSASLTPNDLIAMFQRLSKAVLRPLAVLGLAMLAVTVFFQMASTNLSFSLARLAPEIRPPESDSKTERHAGKKYGQPVPGDRHDSGDVLADLVDGERPASGTASPADDARRRRRRDGRASGEGRDAEGGVRAPASGAGDAGPGTRHDTANACG